MYTYSAASLLRNRRGAPDRSVQAKRAREARETQRQFEVSSRKYQCLRIVGKGAYGVVCEAIDRTTHDRSQRRVAIKKIKEALFHPLDAKLVLRELKLARLLARHPNILGIRTLIKPTSRRKMDTIYVVSNFMDTDLYRLCQSRVELTDKHVRHLMYQTMSGLQFLHSADVLHRDMKTANLLVDRHFNLKICDFGLARLVRPGESLRENPEEEKSSGGPPLTELVVTLWYRAPELVANSNYDAAIDIWAVGCIFAEMLLRRPIFPGKDHLHQLQLITDVMGTPTETDVRSIRGAYARRVLRSLPYRPAKPLHRVFSGAHPEALDLIEKLLQFDATKRATAAQALSHPYFDPVRNSSEEILMEHSIEEEFDFDTLNDPKLVPMRQMIYDEIMLYHQPKHSTSSSSLTSSLGSSRNAQGNRKQARGSQSRSASRSPTTKLTKASSENEDLNEKRSKRPAKSKHKLSSGSLSQESVASAASQSSDIDSNANYGSSDSITADTTHSHARGRARTKKSKWAQRKRRHNYDSRSRSRSRSKDPVNRLDSGISSEEKKLSLNKGSKVHESKMKADIVDKEKTSQDKISKVDAKTSSINEHSAVVKTAPLPPSSPSDALWNKTVSEAARKLANMSVEEPSAKITGETTKPPPTPPQAPSLPQSPAPDRPPSAGGGLAPPPMIFTAPPAAVAKAKRNASKSSEKTDTNSANAVLPSNLLESVEKAQKTSTDLLEEMRRRRVKVQVRAASAALDAALAHSASLIEEPKQEPISRDSISQLGSTIEVGPKSPRKRSGPRPGTSGPLPLPGESSNLDQFADNTSVAIGTKSPKKRQQPKSREDSNKLHGVGAFDFDESSVVRTRSGALKLANVASSPTIGKKVSEKAREAVFKAGKRPMTTNSVITESSTGPEKYKKHSYNKKGTSDQGEKKPPHERAHIFRRRTMGIEHRGIKNSSSDSHIGLQQSRSKENMPNQDAVESGSKRVRKKTTVPQPFTFTSRRKQRSTPKHIRFQREALARRAEREASKGTRKTRFY